MAKTNVVSWVIAGVRYDVDLFDIDGVEMRDAKRATGMTQSGLLRAALGEKDFEAVGALVWIWRRRTEPDLDYEAVLHSISLGVLGNGDEDDEAGEEGSADPPG